MSQQAIRQHLDLALAESFQKSLTKLDPKHQSAVNESLLKFHRGNSSVNLHDVAHFKGFCVSSNAIRIVCQQEGSTLLLLYVDQHDAAYDWGKRHKLARVGNIVRLQRVQVDDAPAETDAIDVDPWSKPPQPLRGVSDKDFKHLDIGAGAAAVLREIHSEDAIVDLTALMRPRVGQALLQLFIEPDQVMRITQSYQYALREAEVDAVPEPVVSLDEAVRAPVNAGFVWVPPPSEAALLAALEGDLESWRIFLHPSQQRLVEADARGAFKVTGGPGTGKSVVAVHRARHLVRTLGADDPRPVLLTAFSRSLAVELAAMCDALCVGEPEVRARIEVLTLTAVAQRVLSEAGKPHALLVGGDMDAAWQEAMAHESLGHAERFYRAEREHVIVPSGAWSAPRYARVPRQGMSTRLGRAKRLLAHRVLGAFESALAARGGGDTAALSREATRALRTGEVEQPWCAVVCDEVQDAGAAELRLLAALTSDASGGRVRDNALFLVGDGYQRLYQLPISLTACGIEVRGRSRRLRLNYRTTEGIRARAVQVVEGLGLDALDTNDGQETSPPLHGYRSLRGGPPPERHDHATAEAEADWIAATAREHGAASTLVLARTVAWLQQLQTLLRGRGVEAPILEDHGQRDERQPLTLCTLHRAKGLEAQRVIIAGAQNIPMKWPGGGSPADKALWERQERCLQYVGMTRARDWCAVSRVLS